MKYILLSGLIIASGVAHAAASSGEHEKSHYRKLPEYITEMYSRDLTRLLNKQLIQAFRKKDLEKVRNLIESGADINYFDHGMTTLTHAAHAGHADAVTELITAGADVNAKEYAHCSNFWNSSLEKPLHAASSMGYDNIVAILLAAGADVNAQDSRGNTPLHHARDGKITAILIAAGADLEIKDARGETPLNVHVVNMCRPEITAELLIAAGADVNTHGDTGYTPLHYATYRNRDKIVAMLLAAGADIDAQDIYGDTALSLASTCGQRAVVNMLLAHKAQQLGSMS
jgi:ankyrin repeat protein